jgi:hypothetical protein
LGPRVPRIFEEKMKAIDNNIGKVVYILGYLSNVAELGKNDLKVFTDAEEVKAYLSKEPATTYKDISLLHGTLAPVFAIPENIEDCIDIFLIVPDATIERDSFIVKCTDLNHLQNSVMTLTSTDSEIFPYDDDEDPVVDMDKDFEEDFDASLFLESDPKDIEDLYVLYGYEVELLYTFDSLLVDEALIEGSISIYKEIENAENI